MQYWIVIHSHSEQPFAVGIHFKATPQIIESRLEHYHSVKESLGTLLTHFLINIAKVVEKHS